MKTKTLTAIAAIGLLALGTGGLQAQQTYHVTELPGVIENQNYSTGVRTYSFTFEGEGRPVYGINDLGETVGRDVLYSGATATQLPPVYTISTGGNYAYQGTVNAWDVNNSGTVAGHGGINLFGPYSYPSDLGDGSFQHGFTHNPETNTTTDVGVITGGIESRLLAINNTGKAAGWAYKPSGGFLSQQAVVTQNGTLTNVHSQVRVDAADPQSAVFAITDSGKLAGFSISTAGNYRAFSYNGTTTTNLGNFGGNNSVALGASETATVGWAETATFRQNAFTHNGTTLTNLHATFTGNLSTKSYSAASGVNESGTIVGQAWQYANPSDPLTFYYDNIAFVSNGTQSWELTSLLNSARGWNVRSASDINASGQIAATISSSANSLYYYVNTTGAVLTPETAWTATGNGSWDTSANWAGSTAPGIQGAAALNLANGVTVTGPSAPTTIYALTVGAAGNGSVATLALQSNATLTVTGDTELRTGGVIDATASQLTTSFLHGNGTVLGNVDAGFVYTRSGQTLSLDGDVTADSVQLAGTGVLRVGGTLHSAISGTPTIGYYGPSRSGTLELSRNATLGGNDISTSITRISTLNAAGHSATLLTSGLASHDFGSIALGGGQVFASTGVTVVGTSQIGISGPGTITGNVVLSGAVVQPGVGNSLTINGSLAGSGLLVGPNITVTGNQTAGATRAILASVDIGAEDATFFGSGRAYYSGALRMSGGTVTAAQGLQLEGGSITGSGIVSGRLSSYSGSITANGALTLGDAASEEGFSINTLNAGNNTVTLLDANAGSVRTLSLSGGTVVAANGIIAAQISGNGSIEGNVFSFANESYGRINATGALTLGNATSASGVDFRGLVSVGNNTLTLLDADTAKIGISTFTGYVGFENGSESFDYTSVYRQITMAGGTIAAQNGIELYEKANIYASGANVTSTVNGDLKITNSILEATAGNTLSINGTLSGYGILLGDVQATALNATAGSVAIDNVLNVGSQSMTVLAQTRAELGRTTSLAGGTIGASNGLGLSTTSSTNRVISGFGTINPGADQTLRVANGILDAQSGQTLTVNGGLEGYGILIGNVTVSGNNTFASAPSGRVILRTDLALGNRTATISSNSTAIIQSGVSVTIADGALISSNGITNQGEISGNGTISANTSLESGILKAGAGQQLAISGALGGYGVVIGNVSATSNALGTPTGSVSIHGNTVAVGNGTGTVYSDSRASIGAVSSKGGNLNTGAAGANIQRYDGYGTLTGDVSMTSGLYVVDVGQSLNITGEFTGYGIVVGSHNKGIAAPTGRVELYNWIVEGRTDFEVYSQGAPSVSVGTLSPGGRIFSAQGWEFGTLGGSGTVGGNVQITSVLSPGFSPGTITFEDDLTLTLSSTLVLEYAGSGAGEFDFLDVEGALTFAGNLQVNFLSGFDPSVGFLPDWFDATSFSGNFASITWNGLAEGKSLTFDSLTGNLGVATIPEPSTYALLALGGVAIFVAVRRKKQTP